MLQPKCRKSTIEMHLFEIYHQNPQPSHNLPQLTSHLNVLETIRCTASRLQTKPAVNCLVRNNNHRAALGRWPDASPSKASKSFVWCQAAYTSHAITGQHMLCMGPLCLSIQRFLLQTGPFHNTELAGAMVHSCHPQ